MTMIAMPVKTKPQPKRAMEQYTDEEVELILAQVPTYDNAARLAKALGRTTAAIMMIQQMAYSGQLLKRNIEGNIGHPGRDNVHLKIGRAKKKAGIFIGHKPDGVLVTGRPK